MLARVHLSVTWVTDAIKYAPGTERVEVRLRRTKGQAEISVEDYRPGIASVDLPHIFSRFYQVTRSDRHAQSGLGLTGERDSRCRTLKSQAPRPSGRGSGAWRSELVRRSRTIGSPPIGLRRGRLVVSNRHIPRTINMA